MSCGLVNWCNTDDSLPKSDYLYTRLFNKIIYQKDIPALHPAEVTFPPLPQPMLVLVLATLEGCKAELT